MHIRLIGGRYWLFCRSLISSAHAVGAGRWVRLTSPVVPTKFEMRKLRVPGRDQKKGQLAAMVFGPRPRVSVLHFVSKILSEEGHFHHLSRCFRRPGPPRPVLESCAWVRSDIHLPCQNWEEQFRFVDRGSETMTKYACQVVRSRRHSSDETPD